ncbi:NusG domain II-containing protein [Pseudomonadota bacterium]
MVTLASEDGSGQKLWHGLWHWLKGSWTDRMLLLISLAGILYAWQWIHTEAGTGPAMVEIYHDEVLLAQYPFPEPGKIIHFEAEGELGISEIIIDSEGVHFSSSPCRTQYCISNGRHSEGGEIIACVPNRILIAIKGSRINGSHYDAMVE